jgi:hypothetical protein
MKTSVSKILIAGTFACVLISTVSAQNNSLVLNGAYIKLNGGTSSTPVFLVVNQNKTTGISRSSGHIISENQYNYIRWRAGTVTGNLVFPFGYSTTDYIPVTMNKTSAGSANVDISTWGTDNKNQPHAGVSGNGTVSAVFKMTGTGDSIASVIDRWWDIYTPSALTANIIMSYRGAENSTTTNSTDNLDIQRWSGSKWEAPTNGTTTGTTSGVGTVSVTGVSAFSPFVTVHRTGILPVTISAFNVYCSSDGAIVRWSTASEQNSGFFDVEKSDDGTLFQFVAQVQAAGNSKTIIDYEITDHTSMKPGYYRLKETDLDGKHSYSKVIYVSCRMDDQQTISVFPNPVVKFLNYNLTIKNQGSVSTEIIDNAGHPVKNESFDAEPGLNISSTDVSELADGFYVLLIHYDNKISKVKFVKREK